MAANTRSAPRRSRRKSCTSATRGAMGGRVYPRRMLRRLVLLALALALLAPSSAEAKRQVPYGWLGVTADGPLTDGAHNGEWDQLAAGGAESARIAVRW